MKIRSGLMGMGAVVCAAMLSGCVSFRNQSQASSSLVGFLYPEGVPPPADNSIPELKLPLRVGLAFLPSQQPYAMAGLEAPRREELLERIRKRFADRRFVSEIVIVPDYYLKGSAMGHGKGFEGLLGLQRLYRLDVIALVSYDQVTYQDRNKWSLGYWTIVGAYVVKGDRHDVTTLMDLAVIDPASRSILLRAGGVDTRQGNATSVDAFRKARESQAEGFSQATDRMIANFDVALTQFESDVRGGKAQVKIVSNSAAGGGGASDAWWLLVLSAGVLGVRRRVR